MAVCFLIHGNVNTRRQNIGFFLLHNLQIDISGSIIRRMHMVPDN